MTYTQDWMTEKGVTTQWDKFLSPLKGKEITMLEIGCFEGRSTVWFLENILTNPNSMIDVVDTFEGDTQNVEMVGDMSDTYHNFIENTRNYKEKINIYANYSEGVLPDLTGWAGERYDIIYIDGSHKQETVMSDAFYSWKLLKKGGILIFDDYGMQYTDKQGINYEPKIAIDAFYSVYEKHIHKLHVGWQYIIKKI